jgi:protein tyrosine phosphatase type IVA
MSNSFRFNHIRCDDFDYYISGTPNSSNISNYKDFLQNADISVVVRLCENTYDENLLTSHGITFYALDMPDGIAPTDEIEKKWTEFMLNLKKSGIKKLAVHCVSGLGRAPTMVCFCMIKFHNYDNYEAINVMRKLVKGSINLKQLEYIVQITPISVKSSKCCIC